MAVILLAIGALTTMMILTTLQRKKGQRLTLRDRLVGSLTPAMIGAGLGFVYARETMTAEALEKSSLPGMYACMGAVIAILVVRLGGLMRLMFNDFFGSKDS